MMKPKCRGESVFHYAVKGDLVDGLQARGLEAVEEHRITFPGVRYEQVYEPRRDRWATVDVAVPSIRLAIEVEMSKPTASDKWHLLEAAGWRVIRFCFWEHTKLARKRMHANEGEAR